MFRIKPHTCQRRSKGSNKTCVHQNPGERSSDPTRDWPRFAHECPGVSSGGVGRRWPAAGLGALSVAMCACRGLFHYPHRSLASGQTTGREHSPAHQQKIGLNIYWPWPCPSEQDPISPSVSLSHQEASIASYPYPSEGRKTENHNHRKLTNLITWTTALSNSMKLWAVRCRANQDGQVMVESSDKTWSTGERNGKPHQYSCCENPMNIMKK